MADLTIPFSHFRMWFIQISQLLFDMKLSVGGFPISFGGLIITGIMISFVLSVFWKGASK